MKLNCSFDVGLVKYVAKFFITVYKKYFSKQAKKEAEEETLNQILNKEKIEKMVQEKLMFPLERISMISARRRLSDPSCVFRTDKCLLRSIQNDSYPDFNKKGKMPCLLASLYNVTDEGLEVIISYGIEHYIEINQKGQWKDIKYEDAKKVLENKNSSDSIIVDTNIIARIPYSSIRHIKEDGDSSITYPHIFCSYTKGSPFDLIYRVYHNYNNGRNFSFFENQIVSPYMLSDIRRDLKNKL